MANIIRALLVAILIACPGFATGNDDPNSLGIYFDQAANQNEAWCTVPGTVTAYLILTNPAVGAVDAWWLGVDFQTISHSYSLAGGGVNRSSYSDPFTTMFYVELTTPLVCAGPTVFATFTIGMDPLNTQSCLHITNYIGDYGSPDDPGARSNGRTIRFIPSVGLPDYPIVFPTCVAGINRQAPVANEVATWGSVKAQFK